MAPRKPVKPKPGDVYLGDGIYGPKPANQFGKMKRELSAAETDRYTGNTTKGLLATQRQFNRLNPGYGVEFGPGLTLPIQKKTQSGWRYTGENAKAILPAKARAVQQRNRGLGTENNPRGGAKITRKGGK
jgi:ribosomal protein L44E